MNTSDKAPLNHAAAAVQPRPAAPAPQPNAPQASTGGGLIAWLALLLAAGALGSALLIGQRAHEARDALIAQQVQTLEALRNDVASATAVAHAAAASVREASARLALVETRIQEAAVQRAQLEALLQSLTRSRDETLAVDIESTLLLAQQHAQMTGSAQPLVAALKSSIARIARSTQPKLAAVHVAMQRDLERLAAHSAHDHAGLLGRIDALRSQSPSWRLLNDAPAATSKADPQSEKDTQAIPAAATPFEADWFKSRFQARSASGEPAPAPTADAASDTTSPDAAPAADWRDRLGAWGDWSHWGESAQRWLGSAWQPLASLVRISRIEHPSAALIAPEQAYFLRENLQLKLLSARIAVLSRQYASARADLQAVEAELRQWFDLNSPAVSAALRELAQLSEHMRANTQPHINASLTALAAANSHLPVPATVPLLDVPAPTSAAIDRIEPAPPLAPVSAPSSTEQGAQP